MTTTSITDTSLDQIVLKSPLNPNTEGFFIQANELALKHLSQKNHDECFKILKKAEQLLIASKDNSGLEKLNKAQKQRFLSVLFNNLGCLFISIDKVKEGYRYLKKAQEIEESLTEEDTFKSVTNLNLALANIKLKKYLSFYADFFMTLQHAYIAESLLGSTSLSVFNKRRDLSFSTRNTPPLQPSLKALLSDDLEVIKYNEHTLLPISHYYVGASLEKLDKQSDAQVYFKKGLNVILKHGYESHMYQKFMEKIRTPNLKPKNDMSYIDFELTLQKMAAPRVKNNSRPKEISRRVQRDVSEEPENSIIKNSRDMSGQKLQRPTALAFPNSEILRPKFLKTPVYNGYKESPNNSIFLLPSITADRNRASTSRTGKLLNFRRPAGSRENQKNVRPKTSFDHEEQALSFSKVIQPHHPQTAKKLQQTSFEIFTGGSKVVKQFYGRQISTRIPGSGEKSKLEGEGMQNLDQTMKVLHQSLNMKHEMMQEKRHKEFLFKKLTEEKESISSALGLAKKLETRANSILDKLRMLKSLNEQTKEILKDIESEEDSP